MTENPTSAGIPVSTDSTTSPAPELPDPDQLEHDPGPVPGEDDDQAGDQLEDDDDDQAEEDDPDTDVTEPRPGADPEAPPQDQAGVPEGSPDA